MTEISTVVTSIDELAPYKLSDDLLLEMVSVTVRIEQDPEHGTPKPARVEIFEPLNLIKHQPPGGYLIDNRQVRLTCAKSAGVRIGDSIRFRTIP
jgi:hypothetical protein